MVNAACNGSPASHCDHYHLLFCALCEIKSHSVQCSKILTDFSL